MGAPTHTDLIDLPDAELLSRAKGATHQHYKGGLYRDFGFLVDQSTGKPFLNDKGERLRGYAHLYPHAVQPWAREAGEFGGQHEGKPRFRQLDGAERLKDYSSDTEFWGTLMDADTGEVLVRNGMTFDLVFTDGVAYAEER